MSRPSAPAPAARAKSLPPTKPRTAIVSSAAAPTEAAAAPAIQYVAPADLAESVKWHGYRLGREMLPLPHCMVSSEDLARPNYTKIKSAEFEDAPDVLDRKADILIEMFRGAAHPMVYAGAGISTSSGIWDYASNAKGSAVQAKKGALTRGFIDALKPTHAHRVLAAMERAGMVEHWLQQNHDGLAHKAGFPSEKINEIHGSWHDKSNPVVKMSGALRGDLFAWMMSWEERADMVFAVGTSFSGLNADRVSQSCAKRHMDRGEGQGLAIITIQATPMDDVAGLRVFCRIDKFMEIVRQKLRLEVDTRTHTYKASGVHPAGTF